MIGSTILPSTKAVRDLLIGIVGRDVDLVLDSESLTAATPGGIIVGEYVSDAMVSTALIAMDLSLAAYVSAALALIPASGAEAAREDGYLSESLLDNAYEVLNIGASLFNRDGAPHLRIGPLYDTTRAFLPHEVERWLSGYVPRMDAAVAVQGYGQGRLSVLLK